MLIFFFKQKTAYEMRISDWSSDVCSSDLPIWLRAERRCSRTPAEQRPRNAAETRLVLRMLGPQPAVPPGKIEPEIVVALAVVQIVVRGRGQPVDRKSVV